MAPEKKSKLIANDESKATLFTWVTDTGSINLIMEEDITAKTFISSARTASQRGILIHEELPPRVYQETLKLEAEAINM